MEAIERLIKYLADKDYTFTVYHVPGVKVGCDSKWPNRMKQQGFTEYEVLHQTKDIFEASDLEQEEQRNRGFIVDRNPYWFSFLNYALMGEANKGKTISENHRQNISKAQKNAKRKPHSEEHKLKIGEARREAWRIKKDFMKKSF